MAAKFCKRDGCGNVAIAGARSREYCRDDYNSEVLAKADDLVRVEVLAGRVTDARTLVSHGRGDTVEVDPAETNVAALVASGAAKVVTTKASSAGAKKGS